MADRTNEEWLTELRSPGPEREEALADLRALLVRGLRYGLADRSSVTDVDAALARARKTRCIASDTPSKP